MNNQTIWEAMELKEYVIQLLLSGAEVITARKKGTVLARPAVPGEEIDVWTKNGNYEGHETAGEGELILTSADGQGRPLVDAYGHQNCWKISEKTFREKYDAEHPDPVTGVYRPLGKPQTFVRTDRDISFLAPWGECQNILSGGYLNVTNLKDIYGIAGEEFQETYERI